MRTLENAVVVITGGSRGIGHAIAEELGFSGAKVVVDYAHSKEPAEELVAKLVAGGSPEALAIQADVTDPEQAAMLIQETVKRFGRIDVLVNNAGINIDRSLKSMSVEDWRKRPGGGPQLLLLYHQSGPAVFHAATQWYYYQHEFPCGRDR